MITYIIDTQVKHTLKKHNTNNKDLSFPSSLYLVSEVFLRELKLAFIFL